MINLFIYIILSASIMIICEFTIGLYTKFILKTPVPWVYMNFNGHPLRSISAFSPAYFIAWLFVAIVHYFVLVTIDNMEDPNISGFLLILCIYAFVFAVFRLKGFLKVNDEWKLNLIFVAGGLITIAVVFSLLWLNYLFPVN